MARRIAFLIGNQTFSPESNLPPLRGPVNDIAAVARLLRDPERGKFEEVYEFLDKPSYQVMPEIEQAMGRSASGDLFLIYYSGHGKLDRNGALCLATADTRHDALLFTSIRAGHLSDLVEQTDCDQVVLLLDCCYSGAIDSGLKGDASSALQTVIDEARGFHIVTASTKVQTTRETVTASGMVMGRFTAALVNGIKAAPLDSERNGRIHLSHLRSHLERVISGSTPQYFVRRGFGDPLISYSPTAEVLRPGPERLYEAKALVNQGFRLGTIDRTEEAIAVFDDMVARFGTTMEPDLLELVAKALREKAFRLSTLGHNKEAMEAYNDLLARFGNKFEPSIRAHVDAAKSAMNNLEAIMLKG